MENTELRLEISEEDAAVLDGFSCATDQKRNDLVRKIISKWCADELHKASVIMRVVNGNPSHNDTCRHIPIRSNKSGD